MITGGTSGKVVEVSRAAWFGEPHAESPMRSSAAMSDPLDCAPSRARPEPTGSTDADALEPALALREHHRDSAGPSDLATRPLDYGIVGQPKGREPLDPLLDRHP